MTLVEGVAEAEALGNLAMLLDARITREFIEGL